MLDHAAVHVGDVQGSIRSDRERDRAEPLVGAREELAAFEGIGRRRKAVFLGHVEPLDRVCGGFADERVAGKGRPEERTAIEHRAAGGG